MARSPPFFEAQRGRAPRRRSGALTPYETSIKTGTFWTGLQAREILQEDSDGRSSMRATLRLSILLAVLISAPSALPQEGEGEPQAPAPEAPSQAKEEAPGEPAPAPQGEERSNTWTKEARVAFELWSDALERKPKLVSLGTLDLEAQASEEVEAALRSRLRLLGKKKVSNRQWKDYWSKQKSLADTFAKTLGDAGDEVLLKGLESWASLASDKVANQDVYLQAIESERDAIEERLESTLSSGVAEAPSSKPAAPFTGGVEASPFELRRQRIVELSYRIRQQEQKLVVSEIAKTHSERQTATQGIMAKALAADLELAKREREVALAQSALGPVVWRALWSTLSSAAESKVSSLADEVALGEQRARSLEVELSLLGSQIDYRTRKKGELEASLSESSSVSGWLVAIYDTVLSWLLLQGWQVALMLLLLWLVVRLALRAITFVTDAILAKVQDDDPDNESQEEARARTIASVFKSVARVGVLVIGGLMGLEMVGINTAPILGSVAILGLAISFGSQSLVKDIVTGFFILLENHFAVGDLVTISGNTGTVEGITLRATKVREFNGTLHIIPNGQIATVANVTRDWSRAIVDVGVAYGSNFIDVERVIQDTAQALYDEEQKKAKEDPKDEPALLEVPTLLGIVDLADSAVVMRVIAKVNGGTQWGIERSLKRRLMDALNAEGIDIPFPQQVVWHHNQA